MTESSTNSAAGVREGDILAGKYRVERILGVGGMGVVVAAHHIQLDEKVALKFLLPEALSNAEAVARFAREAKAAVKIKSEHVARVRDVGTLPNGAPYMVMEYLEGSDLSARIKEHGALAVAQAVEFILQACEALAEAHAMGIVHRDLKPANLFCIQRPDGLLAVKVLDFGISKATGLGSSGLGMTRTQAIMGSPLYMSPEQMASSKNVDARTDLWALGVILFELVTGRVPFEAEAITELVTKILNLPTPSARELRADVPAGFDKVIQRCLEKDRANRYSNVGELAVALADFAPQRSRVSVDRITRIVRTPGAASGTAYGAVAQPAPVDGEPVAVATAPPWGKTDASAGSVGRVKWLGWTAAGVVAAGLAVGAIVHTRKSAGSPPAAFSDTSSAASASATAPPAPAFAAAPPMTNDVPSPAPSASVPTTASVAPRPVAPAELSATSTARPSHRAAGPAPAAKAPPLSAAEASRPATPPPSGNSPNPPAPAAKSGAPRCETPYYFDANGNRLFKPECL